MSKIALYIRLSVEDVIKKDESESITHQRMYLNEYLDNNSELKAYKREEFVDDGYSGTNENRPSFQRMLSEVKEGKISVIIVKDLSRFMRDYIALGDYLENIFPFLGIRFIAINDGYDSEKKQGNGTDLDIQFKSLLYDFYSKDASEKVKTVSTALKKQGKFLAWSPPFGYMKSPDNKHNIIVDEETAWIVKKIYAFALEGLSSRKIAELLNEEKIPTPSKRKSEITNHDFSYNILKTEDRERPTWTNGNVIDILANENYTGTYVFNMQEKSVLTPGSFKFRPKEEWGRVPNNHEALVSMEDFLKVREILDKNRFMQGKNTDYEWYKKSPLQGFARCPVCNHILSCMKNVRKTKTKGERIHYYFSCRICRCNGVKIRQIRAKDLEEQVFVAIKEKYGNETQEIVQKKDSSKELERKVEAFENKKMKSFDKYKLGNISRAKFIETKAKLDEEIESLKAQIQRIKEEEANRKEIREDGLTREMMQKYIQSVICGHNEVLEIQWK